MTQFRSKGKGSKRKVYPIQITRVRRLRMKPATKIVSQGYFNSEGWVCPVCLRDDPEHPDWAIYSDIRDEEDIALHMKDAHHLSK